MIDKTKQYRYASGGIARVLCTDRPSEHELPVLTMDDAGLLYQHTADGKNPYNVKLDLVEVSPFEDYKVDEPVIVWCGDATPVRGYWAGKSDTLPTIWVWGGNSWTTNDHTVWQYVRRPTAEELAVPWGK